MKVYYYERCKTCKNIIERFKNEGQTIELREFFKDRLSKEEIKELLRLANISAKDALRKRDKLYKELELDKKDYSEDELIDLMFKHPSLIARPIILKDGKAFIREIKS